MKKFLLLVLFFAFISNAMATPQMCSLSTTGGLLDSFLQNYYNATQTWTGVIAPNAIKLFWFWFTCEFLWQLSFKKILMNDLQKLYVFFVIRIFTAYFFAQCFVNQSFYLGLIEYFTNLGAQAGGFSISPATGNPFATFSPSGIINIGLCSWNSLFAFLGANTGWTSVVNVLMYGLPMVFITLLITLAAIIMALALVMLALEAYIVLFGGFILCGFAGSSWTQSYWQRYLSYVGGVAIRLLVMCLILGLMRTQLNTLFAYIVTASSGSDYVKLIGVLFNTLICMIVNAFIVLKVPATAGAMLSGTVSGGLGDLVSGAAMVMSGASMVKAFGGGVHQAASSATQSAISATTAASSMVTNGITKMATTSASTAAKAAGESGGKAAAMSQSIGSTSPTAEKPTTISPGTKTEKLDALSNSKPTSINHSQEANTSNDKTAASTDSTTSTLQGSNGITGGNNTSLGNTQPRSAATKLNEASKHFGKAADQAGRLSGSGHSGSPELNINPHME